MFKQRYTQQLKQHYLSLNLHGRGKEWGVECIEYGQNIYKSQKYTMTI